MTDLQAAHAAREYIVSAGWPDESAIVATATEGVSDEDCAEIRAAFPDGPDADQVIAALLAYCRGVVAESEAAS